MVAATFEFTCSMARFELPEEIVRNILSRLPVKYLVRFRSVCKSWCSLIKNTDFIAENRNHVTLNSPYTSLVLEKVKDLRFSLVSDSNGDGYEIVTVFTPFFFEYPVIKGSVNGLICLHGEGKDLIALWNPATREFKPIPFTQFNPPLSGSIKVQTSNIGFGFDKKTNDFKILRFVFNHNPRVQLYSLKNDSWKEISCVVDHVLTTIPDETWYNPYIDGVCYWWGIGDGEKRLTVLSFDFVNEVFERLLLPGSCYSLMMNQYYCCQLAIINGKLSVVGYKLAKDEEQDTVTWFTICAMTRHGVKDSWTEVVSPFFSDGDVKSAVYFDGVMKPVGFWKNYLLLKDLNDEKLVFFDLGTKRMHNSELSGNIQVSSYVESLVPINGYMREV